MKSFFFIVVLLNVCRPVFCQPPATEATTWQDAPTGYYFMSGGRMIMILDSLGNIAYYHEVKGCLEFALQKNGRMTFDDDDVVYFMDSTFTIRDTFFAKNIFRADGHGQELLPDGHFLMLGFDTATMFVKNCAWNDSCKLDSAILKAAVIQEQDKNKNVVFEWHAKDYYAPDDADAFYIKCGERVDWTHANGVLKDKDGNYLISIRNFNEITKVNKTTGSIMWRFGGKHNQFKFINCELPVFGQHDVERLPNGHITLFDNGYNTKPHGARALEFELDEKKKVAKLVWSYVYDSTLTSIGRGNVQRINDSTTLVSFGTLNEKKPCFVVINRAGQQIFKLAFSNGSNVYKVYNYPSLPWQLNRPKVTCIDSAGTTYLDAGEEHATYRWSNDSTTQIIPVTQPDDYSVFVPRGYEGFVSSEIFRIKDIRHCPTPEEQKEEDAKEEKEQLRIFR